MVDQETPFKINIPQSELDYLKKKLDATRFPDELEGAEWDYGVPLADMKRLVARWKDEFDWRKAEAEINKLPQFTRDIKVEGHDTLNIHYVHQKSTVDNAIPLLFVHGWPYSFVDVTKILPLLTASSPDHPTVHVVAPSLPGYGFSEAPKKPGFTAKEYAETCHKLMLSLGYNEYVTQGGDWGFFITKFMAFLYGHKHVKAWHTTFPLATPPALTTNPVLWLQNLITPYDKQEQDGLSRDQLFQTRDQGYLIEQCTQPQTIGYSLADSPSGLLAWIYEKLIHWSDNYPWTDDEVLAWISLYWFSRAGPAASLRIYYEVINAKQIDQNLWGSIPMGISRFPKETRFVPKIWSRALGKVVFESEHDNGGHYTAFEKPNELVADLRKMFSEDGPAFGVVPGKNGYGKSLT